MDSFYLYNADREKEEMGLRCAYCDERCDSFQPFYDSKLLTFCDGVCWGKYIGKKKRRW